jgi:hypothetical protein
MEKQNEPVSALCSGNLFGGLPSNTRELLTALHAEFYSGPPAHANAFRILPKVVDALERGAALQVVVNDFVCCGWHECHPGVLAYQTMINPELLERARALYSPNANVDDFAHLGRAQGGDGFAGI